MIDVARGGFLSDNDRSVLDRFPVEIAAEDLIRCFSLGERDLELVWDRVGPGARLVGGLQIGALRLLGFVPDDVMSAPSRVVEFVGSQVRATASDLAGYTTRRPTRWEHISAVERHVGFRRAGAAELKGLDGWLEEQALEHDRPVTLFAMACDHLMAEGVVRLGVTTIKRAVVSARGRAWTETFRRLEPQLTPERRRNLDGLLAVDPDRAMSPLAWFRRLPAGRSSAQIRELVQVKQQLIDVGADCFDVSMLNPNRVRHLAALGRRMDAQALARMAPERRYPILVATAVERPIATSDLVLDLFDTAVGAIDRKARRDRDEQTKAHVVAASDTVSMFARVARILLDPEIPDYRVRHAVWDEIGHDRLVETAQRADQIEANTVGGYLELVTGQYCRARKFAPAVLGAFDFRASTETESLLAGVDVLADLYATGARKLPADAPTHN